MLVRTVCSRRWRIDRHAPCSAAPPAPRRLHGGADTGRAFPPPPGTDRAAPAARDRHTPRRLVQVVPDDVVVELPGAEARAAPRHRGRPSGRPARPQTSPRQQLHSRRRLLQPGGPSASSRPADARRRRVPARRRGWKNCAAVCSWRPGCCPAPRAGGSARGARSSARDVALVAVRQEQREAGRLVPLRSAGDHELVDHDLGAVDEVAELCLPQDERVEAATVSVLEAERRELRVASCRPRTTRSRPGGSGSASPSLPSRARAARGGDGRTSRAPCPDR